MIDLCKKPVKSIPTYMPWIMIIPCANCCLKQLVTTYLSLCLQFVLNPYLKCQMANGSCCFNKSRTVEGYLLPCNVISWYIPFCTWISPQIPWFLLESSQNRYESFSSSSSNSTTYLVSILLISPACWTVISFFTLHHWALDFLLVYILSNIVSSINLNCKCSLIQIVST